MNRKIMSLILHAENEYHDAVKKADIEAEAYAGDSAKTQKAHLKKLQKDWERFEKAENESLEGRLSEAEQRIEKETAEMKSRLKTCQQEKADAISERLKKEVLSIYGDH